MRTIHIQLYIQYIGLEYARIKIITTNEYETLPYHFSLGTIWLNAMRTTGFVRC